MTSVLILGGTRNLGHFTSLALLEAGCSVTVANRGMTPDELPASVRRMRADRSREGSLGAAIGSASFDLVLDTTTYNRREAIEAVGVFSGRCGRYVFVSTGQVYLVRDGIQRPFSESDYDGPLLPEPASGTSDHDGWRYGVEKRDAESVFAAAWQQSGFPVTTIRLPMVASERDHYGRIQAYVARMLDGGPLLVPEGAGLPLRHVYVHDVARLVAALARSDAGRGEALNVSWGSSMALDALLVQLARAAGASHPEVVRIERSKLEQLGLLPHCSPFSGRWMSELDNRRSLKLLEDLGQRYTPPGEYLPRLAQDYIERWQPAGLLPGGYEQRDRELAALA